MPAKLDMKYLIGALVLVLLGVWGLWHTEYGQWRPGPGGGPMAVPRLMFMVLIPCAVLMVWHGVRYPENCKTEAVPVRMILAVVVWSLAYFWLVRKLGLVSSTALMLILAMATLSPKPLESLKLIVPVAVISAGAFWVMFTQIAPVLQIRVWLF